MFLPERDSGLGRFPTVRGEHGMGTATQQISRAPVSGAECPSRNGATEQNNSEIHCKKKKKNDHVTRATINLYTNLNGRTQT